MAIKCAPSTTTKVTTTDIVKTGTTGLNNGSGITYTGSKAITYANEVKYVTITSGDVYYTISGSKVTYRASSSLSGKSFPFTAEVTLGDPTVYPDDLKTSTGANIDYVKINSTGKYIWTRPTAFDLQADWDYFRSWALERTSSSLSVDSTAGVVLNSASNTLTGTTTHTIPKSSGLRYGDALKFSYTLKPGAEMNMTTTKTIAADALSLKSCGGSQMTFVSPVAALTSQWNFTNPGKDTAKDSNTAEEFTLTVTKPDIKYFKEDLDLKVEIYKADAEVYGMNKGLFGIGWGSVQTDTDGYIAIQGKGELSTAYQEIGTIKAGENSGSWIICCGGYDKSWPKYVKLRIRVSIPTSQASKHKFKTSEGTLYCYGGSPTTGSAGGGGYVGSGGGGYGGWLPS